MIPSISIGAALVQARHLAHVGSLLARKPFSSTWQTIGASGKRWRLDGVADVVAVPVGDADHVDVVEHSILGRLRVAGQERVDVIRLPSLLA